MARVCGGREQEFVDEFNRRHQVGAAVRYWPGLRQGDGIQSTTRSPAQMMSGHGVVWVEGKSSCIALSHVEAPALWDRGQKALVDLQEQYDAVKP